MNRVKITIQKTETAVGDPYRIVKLVNAVEVNSKRAGHCVGDHISQDQVSELIQNRRYEVTVTL
jgi:hypothetical protein